MSAAITSYGAIEWAIVQKEASKGRLTADEIKDLNNRGRIASGLAISGAVILAFTYTWHIMDWLYWGDNYKAFLSYAPQRKQSQKAFQMFFFHKRDLAYGGSSEGLYGAQASFSF